MPDELQDPVCHPGYFTEDVRKPRCNDLDFSVSEDFRRVLAAEYEEINKRRAVAADAAPAPPAAKPNERPRDIAALALSGGGIRSATFNLGVLQALARISRTSDQSGRSNLLKCFDYVCTTSGGAYVGGWWSAWLARKSEKNPAAFPPSERLELDRHCVRQEHSEEEAGATKMKYEHEQISDSAMNAAVDPVHHLRLYGNYLTPKKGAFSSDTWRAIAIISRNLLLTWLILIPILLAAVLGAQAYFALNPWTGDDFLDTVIEHAQNGDAAASVALHRLGAALFPPLILLGFVGICIILWILTVPKYNSTRDYLVVIFSNFVATFIAFITITLLPLDYGRVPRPPLAIAIAGLFLVVAGVLAWLLYQRSKMSDEAPDEHVEHTDYWRNRIVQIHAKFLLWAVALAALLLFGAFGHEVVAFLLHTAATSFPAYLAKAGGWGGLALTILGSIYTAVKSSPAGGADASEKRPPSLLQKIAFAVVPFLLLLTLAILAAGAGHGLYRGIVNDPETYLSPVMIGAFLAAALFLGLALYEFRPESPRPMLTLLGLWAAIFIGVFVFSRSISIRFDVALAVCTLAGLIMRAFLRTRHSEWSWAYSVIPVLFGIAAWLFIDNPGEESAAPWEMFENLVAIGLLWCFTLLIFELAYGQGKNVRSFALLFMSFLTLALLASAPYFFGADEVRTMTLVALIACTLGWVVALGWLADPNALSGHGFYKGRLVRAYLGASNPRRSYLSPNGKRLHTEVTDAVPGDDLLLRDLKNCDHGAPFHLITTTLNLVGGHDLATAQRSSDMFTLSKRHCGSLRTGFRPTDEYMCGSLSLGTAVSVSGAAASPNMGAQTPSAAVTMLMTLFNVRLGYWAPTPNRSYWRAPFTRLWPVYTLQELLSQTNDLLPYCYLTDGGHFDNTSLYPLFARAAKFILISDCGYDPKPTISDLGAVIRKARIDFDTQVTDLKIESLRAGGENNLPAARYTTGNIRYSERHLRMLGIDPTPENMHGVLVYIKPNRALDTTHVPLDVQTYGYTNESFPQTSTGEQFYDEAQFESYRKLGESTIDALWKAQGETFAKLFTT